jgi:hypothetical protein
VNLDLFTGDDCLRKYNGERSEELKQSKNSLQMARGSAGLSLTLFSLDLAGYTTISINSDRGQKYDTGIIFGNKVITVQVKSSSGGSSISYGFHCGAHKVAGNKFITPSFAEKYPEGVVDIFALAVPSTRVVLYMSHKDFMSQYGTVGTACVPRSNFTVEMEIETLRVAMEGAAPLTPVV